MRSAKRSALVPYTPMQMWTLVDEAEHYPEFLPWCSAATVHHREPTLVEGTLELRRGGIRRSFRTRNTQVPGEYIDIELVDGPFRSLEGRWAFAPVGDAGSRIEFEIHFEFESRVLDSLLGPFFEDTLNSIVDAFTRRADEVYGPAGTGA